MICKNNHQHLFDLVQTEYKSDIDINLENEIGETPLMVALNEKHLVIAEHILKNFKDHIEFEEDYSAFHEHLSPSKQQLVIHPLMIALKKNLYDISLRIFA
jgi:hypothetical protein